MFNSLFPTPVHLDYPLPTESISTASSLERNSSALKNIDDRLLGQMAGRHQISAKKTDSSSSVSKYGLSEHQLSRATKDFLRENGLALDDGSFYQTKGTKNNQNDEYTEVFYQSKFSWQINESWRTHGDEKLKNWYLCISSCKDIFVMDKNYLRPCWQIFNKNVLKSYSGSWMKTAKYKKTFASTLSQFCTVNFTLKEL